MTDASFETVKELIGGGPVFANADADLIRAIYEALLDEAPVTVDSIAARTERPEGEVEATLSECNVVYEGDELVGFGGLSRQATPHVFIVDERRRYTWCAWDPLFIARILGVEARVETMCPATGTEITLSVDPVGIHDLRPVSTVLSMRVPDESCKNDVVGNFCNVVHLFASRAEAREWIGPRDDIIVLTPEEGFALGTVVVQQRTGRSTQ